VARAPRAGLEDDDWKKVSKIRLFESRSKASPKKDDVEKTTEKTTVRCALRHPRQKSPGPAERKRRYRGVATVVQGAVRFGDRNKQHGEGKRVPK